MRFSKVTWVVAMVGVVVMVAAGCGGVRKAAKEVPVATVQPAGGTGERPEEDPAPAPQSTAQPREMTVTNFTATVDGMSVNGQLRVAQDSVIWVTVSKLLELGRAKATADSVWVSVPLMNRRFAGTYAEASRIAKQTVSFEMFQSIITSADAEKQIEALAATLGFDARVRMGVRQRVERLSFPIGE